MSRHPVRTTPRHIPARCKLRLSAALGLLCFTAAACGTPDSRRPPGTTTPLEPQQSRLVFDVPALSAATPSYRRYTSADGRFVEEFADWTGAADGPIAGLLVSEAVGAAPLLDAESPDRTVDLWSALRDKKPGFGPLQQMNAAAGGVSWRRASIGTRICAVFLQRRETDAGKISATRAVLTGYFCNPPGASLAPDTAEAAIKAAGLRGHTPAQ